ncbi:MAG TPA: polysaccharide deacetylase family protein [Edaphobacter sp.]|nr:polysaccharide deacetylase family protein [Edaphobacter sp.]
MSSLISNNVDVCPSGPRHLAAAGIMDNHQIFYDPSQRRWKGIKLTVYVSVLATIAFASLFCYHLVRPLQLPAVHLSPVRISYKARPADFLSQRVLSSPNAVSSVSPSYFHQTPHADVRAAFYDPLDPRSYPSLKDHIHQINVLFPLWLHLSGADGQIKGFRGNRNSNGTTNREEDAFNLVDGAGVHTPDLDSAVGHVVKDSKAALSLYPLLDNINHITHIPDPAVGPLLEDPVRRKAVIEQIATLFTTISTYRGMSLQFDNIPNRFHAAYGQFIIELYKVLHEHGLKLYLCLGKGDTEDVDFLRLASANSDKLVLTMYDENTSDPGPLAEQSWFVDGLQKVAAIVPPQKLICGIGNYGYDWTRPLSQKRNNPIPSATGTFDIAIQDVWEYARASNAHVHFDPQALNPHLVFDDLHTQLRHDIWFLDAATALNQLRSATSLGIGNFALYRLGSEESSFWDVWTRPNDLASLEKLKRMVPGHSVMNFGEGDVLTIHAQLTIGARKLLLDDDFGQIKDEDIVAYPRGYETDHHGYNSKQVTITFDDGPNPNWTPQVLDILKRKHVIATFFVVGQQVQYFPGLLRQEVGEGHEIGNHTYNHPDMDGISTFRAEQEVNATERIIQSVTGITPVYYRPPKGAAQDALTNDEIESAGRIQNKGYLVVGAALDPWDWDSEHKKSPRQIVDSILQQLKSMDAVSPRFRGSIVLMHDSGGDRSSTVAALPLLIDELRSEGYNIVPLSRLIGKTRAEVLPAQRSDQFWHSKFDGIFFDALSLKTWLLQQLFLVCGILISLRLLIVGALAALRRFQRRDSPLLNRSPCVAVLIPAYNEESVIAHTICSVLNSDYQPLRVIVIDDGSTDRTCDVVRMRFADEISTGALTLLTKTNAGKAEALNFALQVVSEPIYVGIDADSVVAPDAIGKLVSHFGDPRIGAVAGNVKIGNQINLLTSAQALEYITSQSLERRVLDLFGMVTVIPGAIGAWRTKAVRVVGQYHADTVAEDGELTIRILEYGYKTIYEDRAVAFTEAPITAEQLVRQRFRWSFGTLQTMFKHKCIYRVRRGLGLVVLPSVLLYQLLFPLTSPLVDLIFTWSLAEPLWARQYHSTETPGEKHMVTYFILFLLIDCLASILALALERGRSSERNDLSLMRLFAHQRFAYRYMLSAVLLKTFKRMLDGRIFRWDKIHRTGTIRPNIELLSSTVVEVPSSLENGYLSMK